MVFAIVVALVTFAVIAVAVAAFFIIRSRRAGTIAKPQGHGRDVVKSIDSVGISSSLDSPSRSSQGSRPAAVRTAPVSTTGRPSEAVRPRFVAMGVLAAAVFGSLSTKLWSMQVLSADQYQNKALQNKYTLVATPAPRGLIYDADGRLLVKNRTALTVLADASVADDHDVMLRLSAVLGLPYNVVRLRIKDQSSGAQSQRVVAADARQRDVAFIAEHSDAFPGVTVQERTIRDYPYKALAAHVLGYTGTVSEEELATMPSNRQVELGDAVGKSGIEAFYDNVLAGEHGQRRVVVDSQGTVVEVESETPATRGSDVYLTIKAPAQYIAEQELASLIAPDGVIGKGKGVGGAIVAMDVKDGSILVMASYPTFDPTVFTGGIAQDVWDLYATEESYHPLLNRAISGTYPAASTYKAFTSLAGLKYGFADATRTWDCTGSWDGFNSGDIQHCWNLQGHGIVDLHNGVRVSCDTVFYEIGKDFYYAGKTQGGTISDTALQEEIARFGFGQVTGIDLSGEDAGRIPTPEWKAQHWVDVPTESYWRGGDLTNLVIGQGDVLVTPLQNTVAYGAIATGNLMRPHLLKEVRNTTDTPAIQFEPELVSVPEIDQKNYKTLRDALATVSADQQQVVNAFADWGIDVFDVGAKTGTGEVAGKRDVAWYICYYPKDNPRYVVGSCIEQGGGGGEVAGPPACYTMGALVALERGEEVALGPVAASTGKSVPFESGATEARRD